MSDERFAAYRRRVLGYLGQRDPLRVLARTPAGLDALLDGRSRAALARRPAPGKWSVLEIVAHLADAELVFSFRVRTMLGTPGARLDAFDQDRWAMVCGYHASDARRSRAVFRALRDSNLALLRRVPRARWRSIVARHDLRGRQSLADFVRLEAAHDLNHLRQIAGLTLPAKRKSGAGSGRRVVYPFMRSPGRP